MDQINSFSLFIYIIVACLLLVILLGISVGVFLLYRERKGKSPPDAQSEEDG